MTSFTSPRMTVAGAPADSRQHFEVVNPATGEPFAHAGLLERAARRGVRSSRCRAPAWSADEDMRRELMRELAAAIVAAGDELCELLVLGTGKPSWLPPVEIQASEAWLNYYAAMELPRTLISGDGAGRIELRHRPLGVAVGIIPWTFPVAVRDLEDRPGAARRDCRSFVKPSPFTPLAVLRLGEILAERLPAGVLSVLSGDDEFGAAMVTHP